PPPQGAAPVHAAPADSRRGGAGLALRVAVGLLSLGGLPTGEASGRVLIGDLGLNGELRRVRGALSIALAARDAGFEEVVLPAGNAAEAAAVDGVRVVSVRSLCGVVGHLKGDAPIAASQPAPPQPEPPGPR